MDDTFAQWDAHRTGQSYTTHRFNVVQPTALAGKPVPEREWIVPDWLPVGCVTANYGDGGVGKTLLSQQLMTATATGADWCGLPVMRCRSLGLFCEDSEDELHGRQASICAAYGASMMDLDAMRWVSGVGEDNALISFENDRTVPTGLYDIIAATAKEQGARLVVLDTAADLFPGNENDRHQVRQFIGMLNRLAMEINGAVLLNAHPSRSGLSSGNLDGGSTAWNNSVRSRWSLARPNADGDAEPDTDARVLTKRKANYAAIGDVIRLEWRDGALLCPASQRGLGMADRAAAEIVFLDILDRCEKQGVFVSHSKNAGNYAPKVFGKRADRKGYGARDFEAVMSRLFEQNRIKNAEYDRFGHRRIMRQDVP